LLLLLPPLLLRLLLRRHLLLLRLQLLLLPLLLRLLEILGPRKSISLSPRRPGEVASLLGWRGRVRLAPLVRACRFLP